MTRRLVLIKLIFLFAAVVVITPISAKPVFANDQILSAIEAFKRQTSNQIILIDIRSPQEWRQTGIAQGAKKITIHDPLGLTGFVSKIKASLRGNLDQPIALICAVGGRTTRAYQILKRADIKNVYTVREGMLGNVRDGPGWLKRGLPVTR